MNHPVHNYEYNYTSYNYYQTLRTTNYIFIMIYYITLHYYHVGDYNFTTKTLCMLLLCDIIRAYRVQIYRNLLNVIVSVFPFLNHFTSIGWSPVTLHCKVAVSLSLVETVLEVDENSGEAVHQRGYTF